ncbi:MAG TPA: hypothetical protein VFA11_19950 [Acidimicrobiales bacterium]|nr:hypothetical protein [Acidimicrobiales bacterium]
MADRPDRERRRDRAAGLLPEEANVGSEDPEGQAAAVLEESDIRQEDRNAAPGSVVEHRRAPTVAD